MHEPMVGRSAPRPAEVGILIGRIRSLVVKTWTIGIEAPLTTTPENEQTLAGYGDLPTTETLARQGRRPSRTGSFLP